MWESQKESSGQRTRTCRGAVVGTVVVVLVGGTSICLGAASGRAMATTSPVTPFVSATQPIVWPATAADGTPLSSTVTIDRAEFGPADRLPGGVQLDNAQTYFYVALHASRAYGGDPVAPFAMPQTAAILTTPTGTFDGIPGPTNSLTIDGSWYFPVQGNLTSATLRVAPFTKVLGNERGDFQPWTFSPTPITFVAQPVAVTPDTGVASGGQVPAKGTKPAVTSGVGGTAPGGSKPTGTPAGMLLGAGAASGLVLGAATAGLVSIRRRRAFARADREGRVVLTGPPALVAGAVGLAGVGLPPGRQWIVVKLLGSLLIDGTKRTVTAGPVLEIVTFLALHPGQSFTSVQLRESIWGLGRQPIASQTFRKYMVELRRTCGTGVVVTDAYRYELTNRVTSDWDLFRAHASADGELEGKVAALGLVRGPILHGCFDGKKNSPFSWAYDTANHIEDQVVEVANDLALACLHLDDASRAGQAVDKGLLCSTANLQLRTIDLQVGAALSGPQEVGRRLVAGRAAMASYPNDVAVLEQKAQGLGWAVEAAK